jgi:hypothetical protein
MAFKAIPGHPGGSLGKLDRVKDNKDVGEMGLVEETRIWGKIGLIGG